MINACLASKLRENLKIRINFEALTHLADKLEVGGNVLYAKIGQF